MPHHPLPIGATETDQRPVPELLQPAHLAHRRKILAPAFATLLLQLEAEVGQGLVRPARLGADGVVDAQLLPRAERDQPGGVARAGRGG